MPAVTEKQGLELLTKEIEHLPFDEVLEIYNEAFPEDAYAKAPPRKERGRLTQRLIDHLHSGLDVAEVVELWRLSVPKHRPVWYNEEDERIYYDEAEPAFD